MLSVNTVMIGGKIVGNVEIEKLPTGMDLCVIRVGVKEQRKNKDTNEWEERDVTIELKSFGKMAAIYKKKFSMGNWILAECAVQTSAGKEGKLYTSISIKKAHFVGPGSTRGIDAEDDSDAVDYGTEPTRNTTSPAPSRAAVDTGEIPF